MLPTNTMYLSKGGRFNGFEMLFFPSQKPSRNGVNEKL
jgi:hypothetical protein